MKKYFLLFCIACLSMPLMAQLSVGIKQGLGNHGLHLEDSYANTGLSNDQVPFLLMNTGLVLSFNNELNCGLQMEFNYAPKGFKEQPSTSATDTFFIRKINYLEVPIFSHFEIGKKALRIIIMGGPYLAFKINESSDSSNYTSITTNHPYNHYYEEVRKIDFGIKVALGLRYNINPRMAIFSEVRYDIQMAGGRDIFIDRPNGIQASRLSEIGGVFGILWHIIPQKIKKENKGYVPKENLYEY